MAGKKKIVAGAVLIITLLATGMGLYLWNKPHTNVAGAEAIKTEAIPLYQSFTSDSVNAKKQFLQQVVEVKGVTSKISTNQQNQQVVLVKTATDGASINCTMEKADSEIKAGDSVVLKGICEGLGQGDADLGIPGDLYLVRCYSVK